MDLYFVFSGNSRELEALRIVQPPNLLLSYYYVKSRPLSEWIRKLGYRPRILLDSGAFSAYTKGITISLSGYLQYLADNQHELDEYITLDIIGNEKQTVDVYKQMIKEGFSPIPVYHYLSLEHYLRYYVERGAKRIALGGAMIVPNRNHVARWAQRWVNRYPTVSFHLLGSMSMAARNVKGLTSCDSSAWIMLAKNGYPHHIPERTHDAMVQRMVYNLLEFQEQEYEKKLEEPL
jgi:hypothetical protein